MSTASDSASNTDAEHYHCSSDFSEIEEDSSTGKTTANEIEILDDSNKDETKKTTSPESQTIGSCLKGDLCYSDQNDVDDGFVNDLHKSSRTDAVQESNPRISTDGFGLPEDEGRNKHVFKKPTDTCSSPTKYHSHSEKDKDAFVTEFPKSLEKKSDLLKALNSRNRILDFGDFDDAGKRTGKKFSCNSKRNPLFFPDMSANVQERHYSSSKCTGDSVSSRKQTSTVSDVELSSDDGEDESVRERVSFHKTRNNINSHLKGDHHLYCTDLSEVDDDFVNVLQKTRKRRAEIFKAGRSTPRIKDFHRSEETDRNNLFVKNPDIYSPGNADRYSHSDDDEEFSFEELLKSQNNSGKTSACDLSGDEVMKTDTCPKSHTFSRPPKTDHNSCSNISEAGNDSGNEFPVLRKSQPHDFRDVDSSGSGINKVNLSIYISIDDIEFADREGLKNYEKNTGFSEANCHSCCDKNPFLDEENIPGMFQSGKSDIQSSSVGRQTSEFTPGAHKNNNKNNVSEPDFHSMPTGDAVTESDQQEALQETKHERLNVSDNLLKEALTPGRLHTPSVSTPSSQLPSHQASSNKDFHSVKWVSEFPHNPEQTPSTVTSSAYPKIHQINTNENLLIQLKSPKPWSSEVKSKYLGTLALLDQQVSLEKSEPLTANLLRAVYYHRWLTKKNEKSKENMLTKKDEEERKKQENQAKRDAAVLSYEAWEKKKKSLEAESKKKQEMMREEKQVCSKQVAERRQSATKAYERRKQEWDRQLKQMYRQKKDEEDIQKRKSLDEKSEKMQSSKKAFDKWKHDHDLLHKEKRRKKKEAEDNIKLKQENEWLERKIRNETVFHEWCEKKHVGVERKNMKSKTQEEKHRLKEERDQVALKAYEDWLAKKNLK